MAYPPRRGSGTGTPGPAGENGKPVQVQVADGFIQWNYAGETTWRNLVALSSLKGTDGRQIEMQVANGSIQWRAKGDQEWQTLIATESLRGKTGESGADGADGSQVQLQLADNYIQWKYDYEQSWKNLIPTSQLVGSPGEDGEPGKDGIDAKNISFQIADGFIQWRRDGDEQWINLISTASLKGDPGSPGAPGSHGTSGIDGASVEMQVASGFIQWKRTNETAWKNIVSLSTLQGSPGAPGNNGTNGVDGKSVELQKTTTNIQWRKVGDSTWQNLVALSELVGAPGPASSLTVGGVTTGQPGTQAAVSFSGTAPNQVVSFTIPAGANGANGTNGTNGVSYTPQMPSPRTVSVATPYQHTDATKPYKVIVNARATSNVTLLALGQVDRVELKIGPTAASVALGATGGYIMGVWETGIVGISVTVGTSLQDGGQISADVPAGWYFSINRQAGTAATIVSCFTQALTA